MKKTESTYNITLLEIIAYSHRRLGLKFDYNEEATRCVTPHRLQLQFHLVTIATNGTKQ